LNLIFANPDGTPLKPDSVSASVSLLCGCLGLPKGTSLHTRRHSHGSTLLADGVDLATVSERLGHSSVRVTADIYSHALRGRRPALGRFHAAEWWIAWWRTQSTGELEPQRGPLAVYTRKDLTCPSRAMAMACTLCFDATGPSRHQLGAAVRISPCFLHQQRKWPIRSACSYGQIEIRVPRY
jgi:Phage integrase family